MHTNDITRDCQVIMGHIQICIMHYTFGKPSTTYINWQFLSWDGWHSCHEVMTTERPQHYWTLTGRNPRHLVTIKMHRNQHNWHLIESVDIAWWGQHLPYQNQLNEDHSSNSKGNKHKHRPVIKHHTTKTYGEVKVKLQLITLTWGQLSSLPLAKLARRRKARGIQ